MNEIQHPDDDSFDPVELPEAIRALAGEYHAPPATPKAELWNRIQAARGDIARPAVAAGRVVAASARPIGRWMKWVTGIAAILLAGLGLGRLSMTGSSNPAPASPTRGSQTIYATAAVQHLSRAEVLLTTLRLDPSTGVSLTGQARDLLSSTRLLLDSKAAADPKLRRLLEDLELILVQVAQLSDDRLDEELEFITEGLAQRNVLPRIRTAIPAGPVRL
ncbi:MAG: hypothetical protein AAB075_06010 [Gemmatimonadota bacterium]